MSGTCFILLLRTVDFLECGGKTEKKYKAYVKVKHKLINCNNMSISEIKESIYIIKDIFISDKCDEIVTFIKENNAIHQYTEVNKIKQNNVECTFIQISNNIQNEYLSTLDHYIKNKIGDIIKLIIRENPLFPNNVLDDGYTLRQIHGGTFLHTDGIFGGSNSSFANKPRLLSIIINLNDNYDGGEFHFPKQDVKIILKKGEAICFPPYWTHPHRVSSVSFGEYRYTINTWIMQ